jgi:hypothetical protein
VDFNRQINIATGTATSAYLNLNSITTAPTFGTPFSGYLTESVSYANTNVSGFIDPLAQRDGSEANIATLSNRQIQMIVQVYGSSAADFYDKLNGLNSAFQPYPSFASSDDGFRALRFDQATVSTSSFSTGFIPLYLNVRPVNLPTYNLKNDLVTPRTDERGVSTKAAISLVAKDPRKINQNAKTGTLAIGSNTLTNNGNYVAYPTITFVNTGSQQTATISTSSWTSVIVIAASATTILNSTTRSVTVAGSLQMNYILDGTTSLPNLYSGSNAITLSSLTNTTITYTFNEAWL